MKKTAKSILSLLLAALMGFAVACDFSSTESSSGSSSYSSSDADSSSEKEENGSEGGGNQGENEGGNEGEDGNDPVVDPNAPIFPEVVPEAEDPTPTAVNGENLVKTLKGTPYQSAISNDDYGLTAANKVGAKESEMSRVLYPAPTGNVSVYDVADYGVSTAEENNTRALNALLTELEEVEGLKKVVFGAGTYKFGGTINVGGMKDLYIVGEDTHFVYTSWCTAIQINNSENIHLNGVSFDYDPSPVVAGSVVSCDTSAKTVTIQLDDEFSLNSALYNGGKIAYGSYMEFKDGYPNPTGNLLYNSTGDNIKNISDGSYNSGNRQLTLTFKSMKAVNAGTRVSVAFTMYEYGCVIAKNSKNFYMEGCDIYSAAGMGVMLTQMENIYLNRTNIRLKEGSSRLMTATADGIHAKGCKGDLKFTGSIIENTHDDAMNIASFYNVVDSVYMARKELVCSASSPSMHYPIEVGDTIEIYNPATFELYGTYTVSAVSVAVTTYTCTLNKAIRDDISGYLVGNVTRSPKVTVKNCIFRNKRNRGILLQTRDSEICNNTFENIVHGGMMVHSALDIFSEAILPGNITISGNKFINVNSGKSCNGDIDVFAHGRTTSDTAGIIKKITITNNFFAASVTPSIHFKSGTDSTIANNLFYGVASSIVPLHVEYTTNSTVKDNIRYGSGNVYSPSGNTGVTASNNSSKS